jgi:hypothetical protein
MFTGQAGAPPNTFRHNLVGSGVYGIAGDKVGLGMAAINYYVPASVFSTNVFVNDRYLDSWPPSNYPATSLFAASLAAVGFTDAANGNYRLTTASPYHNAAADGTDVGVDFAALNAAQGGAAGQTPAVPTQLKVR